MHLGGAIFFTDYSMSAMELLTRSGSAVSSRCGRRSTRVGTVQSSGYASERVLSPSPINDT
jgi:hypothetical protein